jgi:hypothetical protein
VVERFLLINTAIFINRPKGTFYIKPIDLFQLIIFLKTLDDLF